MRKGKRESSSYQSLPPGPLTLASSNADPEILADVEANTKPSRPKQDVKSDFDTGLESTAEKSVPSSAQAECCSYEVTATTGGVSKDFVM